MTPVAAAVAAAAALALAAGQSELLLRNTQLGARTRRVQQSELELQREFVWPQLLLLRHKQFDCGAGLWQISVPMNSLAVGSCVANIWSWQMEAPMPRAQHSTTLSINSSSKLKARAASDGERANRCRDHRDGDCCCCYAIAATSFDRVLCCRMLSFRC